MDHQRVVTSFVTNLRGPSTPMTFLGAAVIDIIPVTLIADPVHCPDLQLIYGKLGCQRRPHQTNLIRRAVVRSD